MFIGYRAVLLAALAVMLSMPVAAADFNIGYVQLKKDSRYARTRTYARYLGQALGRPYTGAKVALKEVKFHGVEVDAEFKLTRKRRKSAVSIVKAIRDLAAEGTRFILVDAPEATLERVARETAGLEIVLFNVSARGDQLRANLCLPHVLHVVPSHAMRNDALVQHLVARKWREVLLLVGPEPEDEALAKSFERSARRLGIRIVERRNFILSNDPRQRELNNPLLLTGKADYDVVYIADAQGEFARLTSYKTQLPRPVVGSDGLTGAAWHWAWERHGAPQLEKRFEKEAERHMASVDWAAWIAVKAIATAVQRTKSVEFALLRDYLLSSELELDGFKGNRLNFRPWSQQLRQPMLIASHNWVVDRAPLDGFLHRKNNLDTLGLDEREVQCK